MIEIPDLSHVTLPELFAELLIRKAYQSAFALFGRMANALSIEIDREAQSDNDGPQVDELLAERQQQLGEMWRYSKSAVEDEDGSGGAAELTLFRNVMESCVMAHADKSEQHRSRFATVIGGIDKFKTLQEVPSESAPRWMMCH